ncbi:MAG: PPC domain-containing protein, partial [Longimicrobiales bacterium]|nr:PPC domain-containing protein [Longimicrobiales bacterium]
HPPLSVPHPRMPKDSTHHPRDLDMARTPSPTLLLAALAALLAVPGLPGAPAPAAAQGLLPVGEWVEGALEEGDAVDEEGFVYDAFRLPEGFEGVVSVRAESADFDTYLEWGVLGGGRFILVAENDDFEGLPAATDSRLFARVGPGERPELRVFALDGDPAGRYRVRMDVLGDAASAPAPLPYGSDLEGELSEEDVFGDGVFLDAFTLSGAAGDRVELVLESAWFDAYLKVFGPDGALLAEDDDGMGGTDAYLEVVLPADGDYRVEATSFQPGLGAYRLRAGPDLGVEPAPNPLLEVRITDEERAGLAYDEQRVWHDGLGFSLPSPGADFLLMDAEEVAALMGEGSENVHMWAFQDVLETAQLMVMAIKAAQAMDGATLKALQGLMVDGMGAAVLEESSDWEASRSVYTRLGTADEEAELRCMASSAERGGSLVVCLLGASTDGWSFREVLMGLEVR